MREPFRFKQFNVCDNRSGMKVGTDSILLAAICKPDNANSILDIGTGCGLIALIMAQRTRADILGIDIDESAIKDARSNFTKSPWNCRLQARHISLQEIAVSEPASRDLIICNPPYFRKGPKPPNIARAKARHADELSADILCLHSTQILVPTGTMWLIIPATDRLRFLATAASFLLFCKSIYGIRSKEGKSINRFVIELVRKKVANTAEHELCILKATGNYTDEFINLTKNYYLNF